MLALVFPLSQGIVSREEAPFIPSPLAPQQNLLIHGEWISLFITDDTGPLKCAICWAWWQHSGALSASSLWPGHQLPTPKAQMRALWAPLSRFSFLRV